VFANTEQNRKKTNNFQCCHHGFMHWSTIAYICTVLEAEKLA